MSDLGDAVFKAAINCAHEIDSDQIVLHFDSKREGNNALNQLHRRLDAALSAQSAELAAAKEEVERLRVDAERLDWLLSNPNEVLEGGDGEWFTLDADSEPTYFKTGRAAIDAARAALATNQDKS